MASLRTGLHHRLPPVVPGNGQMVMSAENDIDPGGNAQQFQVLRKVVVSERDHNVGAGVLQFGCQRRARFDKRGEGNLLAGSRNLRSQRRDQAEKADPVSAEFHERRGLCARKTRAVPVADIAGEPPRFGLRQPLHEDFGAEIEFMVAQHREVEPDGVGELDHVFALVEPGEHRRRNHVAAERHDDEAALGLGAGALSGDDSRDLRRAATAVHALHAVPVVHMDEREGKRLGSRGRPEHADEGEQRGGKGERAAGSEHEWRSCDCLGDLLEVAGCGARGRAGHADDKVNWANYRKPLKSLTRNSTFNNNGLRSAL